MRIKKENQQTFEQMQQAVLHQNDLAAARSFQLKLAEELQQAQAYARHLERLLAQTGAAQFIGLGQPMTEFVPATLPEHEFKELTEGETVVMNNVYQVNVRAVGDEPPLGRVVWLSIKRRDKLPIHDWRDLQWIKNQLGGEHLDAVEVYPAEERLVDTSNQYHLFVLLDYKIPFAFQERLVTETIMVNQTSAGEAKNVQRPFAPHVRPADLAECEAKFQRLLEEARQRGRAQQVNDQLKQEIISAT